MEIEAGVAIALAIVGLIIWWCIHASRQDDKRRAEQRSWNAPPERYEAPQRWTSPSALPTAPLRPLPPKPFVPANEDAASVLRSVAKGDDGMAEMAKNMLRDQQTLQAHDTAHAQALDTVEVLQRLAEAMVADLRGTAQAIKEGVPADVARDSVRTIRAAFVVTAQALLDEAAEHIETMRRAWPSSSAIPECEELVSGWSEHVAKVAADT